MDVDDAIDTELTISSQKNHQRREVELQGMALMSRIADAQTEIAEQIMDEMEDSGARKGRDGPYRLCQRFVGTDALFIQGG